MWSSVSGGLCTNVHWAWLLTAVHLSPVTLVIDLLAEWLGGLGWIISQIYQAFFFCDLLNGK